MHKQGAGREENLTNSAAAAEEALREEQHHIVEATHTACGYLETSSDRSEGAKPTQQWKSLRWRTRAATSCCSHDTCGRAHTERHGGRRGCAHLAARGISVRKRCRKIKEHPNEQHRAAGALGAGRAGRHAGTQEEILTTPAAIVVAGQSRIEGTDEGGCVQQGTRHAGNVAASKKNKRKREQTVSGEPQSSSLGRRDGGGGAHHS